jgi:hypothetical protein
VKSSLLSSPHLHVVWSNVGEVKERSYVIDVPADSLAPPKPAGGDDCVKLKRKMEKTGEGRQSSESTRSTASDLMFKGDRNGYARRARARRQQMQFVWCRSERSHLPICTL